MKLKLFIIAFLLSALPLSVAAQDDLLKPQANQKGKYGYVDSATGEFLIAPQYDEAQPFFQNNAIVRKGNSYGVIDMKNQPVLPFKYNLISPVDDNTYLVAVEGRMKDGHLIDEKYGFISTSGQIIIKPEYVEMSEFNQFGLAYIRHSSGKCGFIDRNYQFVVPALFDFAGSFNSKGVNWINRGGRINNEGQVRGGSFMLIMADGNMFIPGEYGSIGYFIPNKASISQEWLNTLNPTYKRLWTYGNQSYYFRNKVFMNTTPGYRIPEDLDGFWTSPKADGSRNGVYDAEGRVLIEPDIFASALYPDNNIAIVMTSGGNVNYVNLNNNTLVLTKDIQNAYGFQNGYAVCVVNKEFYIVDEKGGCCSKGYDQIFPGNDGMHVVAGRNGYGLIGYDGHEIVPCTLPDIWPIKCGYSIVKVGSQFAFAGKDGLATEAKFVAANNFSDGYTWAKDATGWNLYDTSFRQINVKPLESGHYTASEKVFWGKDLSSHLYRCYSLEDGKERFANTYHDVTGFNVHRPKVALVKKSGTDSSWGIIDLKGNELIPCSFEKELALKAYDMYLENDCKPWTPYDTHFLNLRHNPARNKFNLTHKIDESFWDF